MTIEGLVIPLTILIILTVVSFVDEKFKFLAGASWILISGDLFLPINDYYYFIGLAVGIYFLITGAMHYVPE